MTTQQSEYGPGSAGSPSDTASPTPRAVTFGGRTVPSYRFWAGLGLFFVIVQAVIYGAWLISGPQVTSMGADVVPTYEKVGVVVFEVLSVIAATYAVARVGRQCRRERRVTLDAAFVIAWVAANWQDPLCNLGKPVFLYNAYFVNVGNWTSVLPGYNTPDGMRMATDILGTAGIGYLWFFLPPLLAVTVLRKVRVRKPDIRPWQAFAVAFGVTGGFDGLLEGIPVYLHMWGYPSAVHGFALFGGTDHQFPLLEPLMWGSTWAVCALMRFYVDDRGNTLFEQGASHTGIRNRGRDVVRVLAITGAINMLFLAYNFGLWAVAWLPDTTIPHYPSYQANESCGHGQLDPCPVVTHH